MGDFDEFDAYVARWEEEHPGEDSDVAALFAQWLSNETGQTIIGRQMNGDGIVVAAPDA